MYKQSNDPAVRGWLVKAALDKGTSLTALSEKIFHHKTYLNRVKNGTYDLHLETILDIEDALGYKHGELVKEEVQRLVYARRR